MVAALVTIAAVEFIGSLLFPQAAPVDWTEQVAVDTWVASIPLGAKLTVVLGWLLGALVGAWAAARIARRSAIGWVPAGLVVVAGIADITMIPHPLWMSIAALVSPIAGGWIGTRLVRKPIAD